MTKNEWKIQAWLWRRLARLVPTCFLQWEIEVREGVEVQTVGANFKRDLSIVGPAIVTVNRD